MFENGMSAADIAAVTGNNNNSGFNDSWWILIILFVLWGGGFGNTAGDRPSTVGDIQRGFDTNTIVNKLDGVAQGLCSGFYDQNNTMLTMANDLQKDMFDGFSSINSTINQARFENKDCCCQTQRGIDSVKFDMANYNSDLKGFMAEKFQRLEEINYQNKIEALQNQVNQLTLKDAMCGVVRYPTATTYNGGPNPCYTNNCGCC